METLEKGVAHVGESDGVQTGTPGDGLARLQEHHGGQLFVVANHDKFPNGAQSLRVFGTQQTEDLWLKHLRGFVDDGMIRS